MDVDEHKQVVGDLFGPLSHGYKLKRVHGPDNTEN